MSWFWKHRKKNVIIKQECYDKLSPLHKQEFQTQYCYEHAPVGYTPTHEVDNDGSFILSAAIAMETDNVVLGTVIGGSLEGAIIGEIIADEMMVDNGVDDIDNSDEVYEDHDDDDSFSNDSDNSSDDN